MKHTPIDAQFMRDLFYYEPELGQIFYRRNAGSRRKGERAGFFNSLGYRSVSINNIRYKEHRIIYAVVTGRDPGDLEIHHINGVVDHNDFYNLQALTQAEHALEHRETSLLEIHPLDRTLNKRNTSGINGVNWSERRNKWRIQITINGNNRELGCCKDLETAKARICDAWDEYQAELQAELQA